MITQIELKEVLDYSPLTGVFRWLISTGRVKAGDVAGSDLKVKHITYRRVRIDGEMYLLHRLAWLYIHGEMPPVLIDHADRNGSNNRISNLSCVDFSGNNKNRKKQTNTKRVAGVRFTYGNWRARIKINWKECHLGTFKSEWDAICARKSAEYANGFHVNHGRAV